MSRKQIAYLVLVFALLLLGRLCIAGSGYLDDPDELLYVWIHMHFAGFAHASTWSQCMFDMQGQPPEIAIRLVEYITTIPLAAAMGKSMLHPDILYVIGLYNIAVSLLILFVFFRILLKLQFSFELALAGVVLMGTLFNYSLYTRHILPYEHALLFQLLAFNLLLRDNAGYQTVLVAGLLSAIGLTNYYGCFMFIFINGGYIVLANYKNPWIAIKRCLVFALPFPLLVLSYEALARANGASYFDFLKTYSGTVISGGSFDEGLIYVFLYFHLVEKWWGVALLVLFFMGAYLLFKKSDSVKVQQALLLGIVAYLSFGSYSFFLHKMLFSGRVLHIYYPFIIIGVLGFIQQLKLFKAQYTLMTMICFALVNYAFVIRDFSTIGYPRTAIYKYGLFDQKGKVDLSYYEEMPAPMHYSDRSAWGVDSIGTNTLPAGHYVIGNLGFMCDVPDSVFKAYKPWRPATGDSLVVEELHFESHPAYTMEYCTRFGRNFYLEKKLKIRIVKLGQ